MCRADVALNVEICALCSFGMLFDRGDRSSSEASFDGDGLWVSSSSNFFLIGGEGNRLFKVSSTEMDLV